MAIDASEQPAHAPGSDTESAEAPALVEFLELYAPALVDDRLRSWTQPHKPGAPFLTVLVRTTGRRPRELEETLLCLAAQVCRDFTVTILMHSPTDEDAATTERQVAEFRELSQISAKVERVEGGYRGVPLQIGVAGADSDYAVILDDDDYVTADWVDTYAKLRVQAPGRVLRVRCATRVMSDIDGAAWTARACSTPTQLEYQDPWSILQHLVVNRTPIHAFAFPLFPVRRLGVAFRTDLPVVEDWDFLLRVASVCGVQDSDQPTAVYNRHEVKASEVQVAPVSWRDAEADVRRTLKRPVLLQPREWAPLVDLTSVEARYVRKPLHRQAWRAGQILATRGPRELMQLTRLKWRRLRARRRAEAAERATP